MEILYIVNNQPQRFIISEREKIALGLLYILKDIVNNTLSNIEPSYQCCINFIY